MASSPRRPRGAETSRRQGRKKAQVRRGARKQSAEHLIVMNISTVPERHLVLLWVRMIISPPLIRAAILHSLAGAAQRVHRAHHICN
jgi:hypothetical protein